MSNFFGQNNGQNNGNGQMSIAQMLVAMSQNNNENQRYQNNRRPGEKLTIGRIFTDALAQIATGNPNARSYWTGEDLEELYKVIEPQLNMLVATGVISLAQKRIMWDDACAICRKRRKLGTLKTTSIMQELYKKYNVPMP